MGILILFGHEGLAAADILIDLVWAAATAIRKGRRQRRRSGRTEQYTIFLSRGGVI
ncbi:hypothetical protein ACP4OV_004636 [Aristida adscensionis]